MDVRACVRARVYVCACVCVCVCVLARVHAHAPVLSTSPKPLRLTRVLGWGIVTQMCAHVPIGLQGGVSHIVESSHFRRCDLVTVLPVLIACACEPLLGLGAVLHVPDKPVFVYFCLIFPCLNCVIVELGLSKTVSAHLVTLARCARQAQSLQWGLECPNHGIVCHESMCALVVRDARIS